MSYSPGTEYIMLLGQKYDYYVMISMQPVNFANQVGFTF